MKKIVFVFASVFLMAANSFAAAADSKSPMQMKWAFDGAFGTVDRAAAQRGFQVYKEVCASCHSLRLVSYRNLVEIGFSEDEAKAIAAEYTVMDGPDDAGEMYERPGRLSDKFVPPYPNVQAAKASNGGAYPPDMSLIVKARPDGANYVYSILAGYKEAPADLEVGPGLHYNPYFSGGQIAMPAPLSDGMVDYQDETLSATTHQMSHDVVTFLQWAAEPEMEARKRMGLKVLLYLAVFTVLFWLVKKRMWRNVKK